jgi:hypothetical protein
LQAHRLRTVLHADANALECAQLNAKLKSTEINNLMRRSISRP